MRNWQAQLIVCYLLYTKTENFPRFFLLLFVYFVGSWWYMFVMCDKLFTDLVDFLSLGCLFLNCTVFGYWVMFPIINTSSSIEFEFFVWFLTSKFENVGDRKSIFIFHCPSLLLVYFRSFLRTISQKLFVFTKISIK